MEHFGEVFVFSMPGGPLGSLYGELTNSVRRDENDITGGVLIDHKKLAVIHIVIKELALSDQQYRDTLEKITGVRSAKELDDVGFRKAMNYFARSKYYQTKRHSITFRQKMFIKDLKNQLDWTHAHFTNFLKKYYKISTIEDLSRKEASNLIQSLKNVIKHERLL